MLSFVSKRGGYFDELTLEELTRSSGARHWESAWCYQNPQHSVTSKGFGRTTVLTGQFVLYQAPITVAWQASDLPTFTPSAAPLIAYNGAVPTPSSTSKTSPQTHRGTSSNTGSPPPTSSDNRSLSMGAKAGIGVGVGIGALLILALLIWVLFVRRKRNKQWAEPQATETQAHSSGKSELDASGMHEMEQRQKLAELNPNNTRSELEGGWHGLEASPRSPSSPS